MPPAKKSAAKADRLLPGDSPVRPSPEGRASAGRDIDLLEKMQEQHSLLELQNEQLSETRAELEQSHHRYADLYDLAPVGYLTLDGDQSDGLPIAGLVGSPFDGTSDAAPHCGG